jgi:hypothetical protein
MIVRDDMNVPLPALFLGSVTDVPAVNWMPSGFEVACEVVAQGLFDLFGDAVLGDECDAVAVLGVDHPGVFWIKACGRPLHFNDFNVWHQNSASDIS